MQINEITKEVFEAYVPAAQMPERDTSVYDRLQKAFERAYGVISREIIGTSFVSRIEENAEAKAATRDASTARKGLPCWPVTFCATSGSGLK